MLRTITDEQVNVVVTRISNLRSNLFAVEEDMNDAQSLIPVRDNLICARLAS